jgi:branched-chain amino acid transport system ATP-binding protein
MAELLAVDTLSAGWGAASVLSGVSFRLEQGQSLALLGRNGMGKTTLLSALLGIATHHGGAIRFRGRDITRRRTEARALAGIGWVPQERNIFRSLTVEENLTAVARPGRWDVAAVWEMFPRLRERRRNMGNQLSGGEQQMLAIGRALVLTPQLLLLDEPTEGLAPIIVEELLAVLRRLVRDEGLSAIIVEQHARKVLNVTDRALILERGTLAHEGPSAALAEDAATLDRYLGVGAGGS